MTNTYIKNELKQCSICKNSFPATPEYFYKNKTNKNDGLYPYCKSCTIKKSTKWLYDNYDKKVEHYNKFNKSEKGRQMRYAYNSKYIEDGKQLEWQRNNKDKIKVYNSQHRNHDITDMEWESCQQFFDYSCAYCGITEEESIKKYNNHLHKEHVAHDGENDISNCVPSCKSCNSSKSTSSLEEWFQRSDIFTEERLYKVKNWLLNYKVYLIK